jgi:hypothetical protein
MLQRESSCHINGIAGVLVVVDEFPIKKRKLC